MKNRSARQQKKLDKAYNKTLNQYRYMPFGGRNPYAEIIATVLTQAR